MFQYIKESNKLINIDYLIVKSYMWKNIVNAVHFTGRCTSMDEGIT